MRTHIRGHEVTWDGTIYRYLDGQPAEACGGEPRPCPRCHLLPTPCNEQGCNYVPECAYRAGEWWHDPCLGHLLGVQSACCGHGIEPGYFTSMDGMKHHTPRLERSMDATPRDRIGVYKDAHGEWRWNRIAPNGEAVGASTEGYKDKADCYANLFRINGITGNFTIAQLPE